LPWKSEIISWSFTFRGKNTLRVSENRVLGRIFGLSRDEIRGENYIMRSFIIILFNKHY
jgi:hypothetical protein